MMEKIGFGGSCHWCTEAVFNSLIGVTQVDQGWIAPKKAIADENESKPSSMDDFSEAVIVHYDNVDISLGVLIAVHLHSHSCTSNHSMRAKYRSAIYTFSDEQITESKNALSRYQTDFSDPIITQVLPFDSFKLNDEKYLNYYQKNADKDFCVNFINPKLAKLRQKYQKIMKP